MVPELSRTPSRRVVVVVALLAALLAVGALAGTAAADGHTKADAPYYENTNESANASIHIPERQRYSGAQNVDVRYTLYPNQAFDDVGMADGIHGRWGELVVEWLDHSDCSAENVAVFGIDRGNDDPGSQTDEDLNQHVRQSRFTEDGGVAEFYTHEDFAGDPPAIYPADEIVLELSDESSGGACVDVPAQEGNYTADLFGNGTDVSADDTSSEVRGIVVETNEVHIRSTPDSPTPIPIPVPDPLPVPDPIPTPDGTPTTTESPGVTAAMSDSAGGSSAEG